MKHFKPLLLLAAFTLSACGPNNTIQKNAVIKSLELAPDASTVMVSYTYKQKYYVWVDSKVQGPYDFLYYPRFSQSRTEPELLVTYQKEGEWYVRFKEQQYGPFGKEPRAPRVALSPHNDISIPFKKDGQDYFLYNDSILGPYAKTGGWVYSPNSQHYAFWYVDETNFAYELDGEKFSQGIEYQAPFFLSDNSLGVIRSDQGKLSLYIDNRKLGPYDFALPPVFSRTGKDYALLCDIGDKSYIITKHDKWGPYENILGSPQFSPDETTLSFIYTKNTNKNEYYLHLVGEEFGPYQYLLPLLWSDQGPAYAFLFSMEERLYLNYKGEIMGPYSRLTDIRFNGGDLYLATISNQQVIINNLH